MTTLSRLSRAARSIAGVLAIVGAGSILGPAHAGSIFLTGHDIDLHDGADGYDAVVLDYLRGKGTADEIAAADYRVGVIRSIDNINPAFGSVGGVFSSGASWAGGVTEADPTQFADATAFASFLSTIDVLVVASQQNCGGCDFSPGDSGVLNSFSSAIATFFNAGGDIFGMTVADIATGYDYLPATAAASGPPISGMSGFVPTAAGAAIGITDAMVNGDQTHNRFTQFDPDFVVFETRPNASLPGGQEIISIGIRDARISGGGVSVGGDCGGAGQPACGVPEPATLPLMAFALLGLGWFGSRRMPRPRR